MGTSNPGGCHTCNPADFNLAKSRVEDLSEREVELKLEEELPGELRKGLKLEKLRKREMGFWVKFGEPLPLPLHKLETFVGRILKRVSVSVENCKGGYLVDCGSREGQESLVVMDRWGINGSELRVEPWKKGMSLEEMFLWVGSQLEFLESEERYACKKEWHSGGTNRGVGFTHVVGTQPTNSPRPTRWGWPREPSYGPGKGKGKGGKGAWDRSRSPSNRGEVKGHQGGLQGNPKGAKGGERPGSPASKEEHKGQPKGYVGPQCWACMEKGEPGSHLPWTSPIDWLNPSMPN